MKYALLIYGDENGLETASQEERQAMYEEYDKYAAWLVERGWMRGGEELSSTKSATSVRVKDGELLSTDGPFAETKEQLGGFFLIECDDLDQAIEAAGKLPGARRGSVEVRPLVEGPAH
jgi:hypothetical protein